MSVFKCRGYNGVDLRADAKFKFTRRLSFLSFSDRRQALVAEVVLHVDRAAGDRSELVVGQLPFLVGLKLQSFFVLLFARRNFGIRLELLSSRHRGVSVAEDSVEIDARDHTDSRAGSCEFPAPCHRRQLRDYAQY
jgi:aromatic ring-cleaving dioxygenase